MVERAPKSSVNSGRAVAKIAVKGNKKEGNKMKHNGTEGKRVNPLTHIVSNYAINGAHGVNRWGGVKRWPDTELSRAFRSAVRAKGVRV